MSRYVSRYVSRSASRDASRDVTKFMNTNTSYGVTDIIYYQK